MSSGGGGQPVTTFSSSESSSGPWEPQVPYITSGFEQAKNLYNRGEPAYYPKETLAGFDPASLRPRSTTASASCSGRRSH